MTVVAERVEGPAFQLPSINLRLPSRRAWALGCDSCTSGRRADDSYCTCRAGIAAQSHAERVAQTEIEREQQAAANRQRGINRLLGSLPMAITLADAEEYVHEMLSLEGKKSAAEATIQMLESGVVKGRHGLLLHGENGAGKTTMLYLLARTLIESGRSVCWVDFITWAKAVQARYGNNAEGSSEELVQPLINAEYLFIDNLGTDPEEVQHILSRDKSEMVGRVLEHRINADPAKPTFVASNLNYFQLEAFLRPHAANRLLDLCSIHEVGGANFRK